VQGRMANSPAEGKQLSEVVLHLPRRRGGWYAHGGDTEAPTRQVPGFGSGAFVASGGTATLARMGNPVKIDVGGGTLVYRYNEIEFHWRGDEFIEVRWRDDEEHDPPFDAIHVWNSGFGAPRCQSVQEFIAECQAFVADHS
jgi:hypothetical protein